MITKVFDSKGNEITGIVAITDKTIKVDADVIAIDVDQVGSTYKPLKLYMTLEPGPDGTVLKWCTCCRFAKWMHESDTICKECEEIEIEKLGCYD